MTTSPHDIDPAPVLFRTAALRAEGLTSRQLAAAVAAGQLIRLRRGAYCDVGAATACVEAAQQRGRLTCVSELRRRGVFVRDRSSLHIHLDPTASRLAARPSGFTVHRRRLHRSPHPDALTVEGFDAVAQAVLCQDPRAAIATLDSALRQRVLVDDDLDELFAVLPRRYRRLCGLLDPRAESGPESFVRLMLRSLGLRFDVQVAIDGVGRVDFLVEGVVILECDSQAHHSSWEAQLEDRRRDLAAFECGYLVIRLVAEDIMWSPARVRNALSAALARVRRR